jgi:hypothetical protein
MRCLWITDALLRFPEKARKRGLWMTRPTSREYVSVRFGRLTLTALSPVRPSGQAPGSERLGILLA